MRHSGGSIRIGVFQSEKIMVPRSLGEFKRRGRESARPMHQEPLSRSARLHHLEEAAVPLASRKVDVTRQGEPAPT